MKIRDILTDDELKEYYKIQEKIEEAKSVEEVRILSRYLELLAENAVLRYRLSQKDSNFTKTNNELACTC